MSRSRRNSLKDAEFYRVVDSYRQPVKKTIPNVELRVKAILHESAKRNVKESNPEHDRMSHRISSLFGTGSDAHLVKGEISRLEKGVIAESNRLLSSSMMEEMSLQKRAPEQSIFDSTQSLQSIRSQTQPTQRWHSTHHSWESQYTSRHTKPQVPPMHAVSASQMLDRVPGGKYHIPDTTLPYREKYEAMPQRSAHTTTTPKMWPETPTNSTDATRMCSKSEIRKDKTLSSLQSTLLSSTDLPSHLQKSLALATKAATSHAKWLHNKEPQLDNIQSSLSTVTAPTTISKRSLAKRSSTSATTTSAAPKVVQTSPTKASYDAELSQYVGLKLVDSSKNPFRSNLYAKKNNFRRRQMQSNDPKDYSNNCYITTHGKYTVARKNYSCFDPSKSPPPSKEFINRVLGQVTRRLMVSYDTKIIEVGATLKALQDLRHPTPGVAAIIDLHRAFIDVSVLNPNNWWISRSQFASVMHDKVPWLADEVIGRLVSAFDPHASGLIKYVTVTSVLMMGNRPAMTQLIALLRRDTSTSSENNGEAFLLRLIHGLYEDCEGGVDDTLVQDSTTSAHRVDRKGIGMRLEDISESLLCCASSIEDELTMTSLAQEVVQELFEMGQQQDAITYKPPKAVMQGTALRDFSVTARQSIDSSQENRSSVASESTNSTLPIATQRFTKDTPLAEVVLKHQKLRSVKQIPRVSQEEYVTAVMGNKRVLTEFTRQLTRFRELLMPYTVKGSISYKDSLANSVGYGSKAAL